MIRVFPRMRPNRLSTRSEPKACPWSTNRSPTRVTAWPNAPTASLAIPQWRSFWTSTSRRRNRLTWALVMRTHFALFVIVFLLPLVTGSTASADDSGTKVHRFELVVDGREVANFSAMTLTMMPRGVAIGRPTPKGHQVAHVVILKDSKAQGDTCKIWSKRRTFNSIVITEYDSSGHVLRTWIGSQPGQISCVEDHGGYTIVRVYSNQLDLAPESKAS